MKKADTLSLPKGWEIKKLKQICIKITDGSHNPPKGIVSSNFLMLSSKNIFDDLIHYEDPRYLTECDFEIENKRTQVNAKDVLLTIVGTIGRVAVVPDIHPKFTLQRSVAVLKAHQDIIDSRFLMFSLQNILKFITDEARGVAQKGIYLNQLKEIEIPLPPLPEQQRIVSILDEAFAAIAKAKANAERNLKNAKELFESYLQGVFDNGEWETKTIEMVCDEIFAGGDAPKNNYSLEPNEKHNIPIYANAVKDKGLYGYTDFARVTKPCVTIAARGSGTGHTELRTEPFLPIVRLIVCIPDIKQISTEFLKYTLDNLVIQRSGSAIPQLTVPMIKDYKIPVPSIEEQKLIIEKAEALKEQIEQLEKTYLKKIDDLEELKKSILQKAFSGELEIT